MALSPLLVHTRSHTLTYHTLTSHTHITHLHAKVEAFTCGYAHTCMHTYSHSHPHTLPLFSLTHSISESTLIIADSHMFSPLPPPRPFSPTPPGSLPLALEAGKWVSGELEDCFQRERERERAEGCRSQTRCRFPTRRASFIRTQFPAETSRSKPS